MIKPVSMRELIVTLCLCGTLFYIGCTTPNEAPNPDKIAQATAIMGNTLLVTKKTVVSVMTAISSDCKRKIAAKDTCQKAEIIYLRIQSAINAAEQSVVLAATTGDLTQANANQAATNGLVTELIALRGTR